MPTPSSLSGPPTRLDPFGSAVAGALAAAYANFLIYPLDVVSTRMQVQSRSSSSSTQKNPEIPEERPSHTVYAGTLDGLRKIMEQEGLKGLYAGLATGLGGSMLNNFAYFYFYTIIRRLYLRSHPGSPSTLMELLLGMLAGACARLCTTPVNIITTRQQMRPGLTSLDILRGVLKTEGPAGLYAGLPASLVLTINPAITYGLFERMKSANFPEGAFARGAASKAVATIVTYPYIMAKVRLQVRDGKVYNSAMEVLGTVVKEQGLAGLYQGLAAQLYKSVLTQAILFVSKDYIEKLLLGILVWMWHRRHAEKA